jgi:hypothetical protein
VVKKGRSSSSFDSILDAAALLTYTCLIQNTALFTQKGIQAVTKSSVVAVGVPIVNKQHWACHLLMSSSLTILLNPLPTKA